MGKRIIVYVICFIAFSAHTIVGAGKGKDAPPGKIPLSEETEECIDCHKNDTPGIVEDWLSSRHAKITPEMALKKPLLERRVSGGSIPKELRSVAVGCYECHSLNPSNHKDNFEHADYKINVIVSPNDCKTCHSDEVEEYSRSKKAHAADNLEKNAVFSSLVEAVISVKEVKDNKLISHKASKDAKNGTCYACHGAVVSVTGRKKIVTSSDVMYVPSLSNWPNQGVGRINPDGSYGACTACHPRHSFSIETARKPDTCAQCHRGPSWPAYEVYSDSKHGNIVESKKDEWNWENVPWTAGKDFKAPTCVVCHNGLIVDLDGNVIAKRTHDFGARLWVRLIGLPYSHQQPKDGRTYIIKNQEGMPLPTTFDMELAKDYLIDKGEQDKRRKLMRNVCQACHGSDVVNEHFARLDAAIEETDQMVLAATELMEKAWKEGLADKTNMFDEALEQRWIKQWLFYANTVRYAYAMGSPDYATFEHGWWDLTNNLQEMHELIMLKSKK